MAQHVSQMDQTFWTELKRQFVIIVLMVILTTTSLPLAIFILLPTAIVLRLVVKVFAAAFRPDLAQIFRGKGVTLALDSIESHSTFNILLYQFCSNGTLPAEQFRLQFEQRVVNYADESGVRPYEKLTQTWTDFMGFLFWRWDSSFKLENHIRLYDYTDPGLALPAKCNEDNLKRITGDLIARPWVEGQSPWEILIVPDYRTNREPEKAGSVAILRIHHAMIDGYSILTMLLRFSGSLSVKRVLPNFPKLSPSQQLTRPLLLLLKLPYDLAELAVDSIDFWHFMWKKRSRKYHVFFSDAIDVEKMKKIRRKYGVDYNATIYSITAGAIRRLLLAAGDELPKSLSVFVPFPLPNHPGGLVVHAAVTVFKFCPRIASAKQRICQIGAHLKTLQELPTGPTTLSWLADILPVFPTCLLRLGNQCVMTTVGMTSIPGPDVEISMVGRTKLTGMCWALGHISRFEWNISWNYHTSGQPDSFDCNIAGVAASMMTMAGKQRIALTIDKALFEGYKVPTLFAQFINQEIEDLLS